jgi:hypothetical protein
VAVASDGSRMNRCEREYFRHYFIPTGHESERTVYLRPENKGFQIDDGAHKARGGDCRCTWEPFRLLADVGECSQTAEARLTTSTRVGTGRMAGHAVVRYRAVDQKDTETELSLAPDLGCEVIEEEHTWPGTFGIPGARWRYRVTSYTPGEPDRSIFQLPVGYTVENKRK